MWAVELCSNKILKFLTGVPANGRCPVFINGRKIVVVVVHRVSKNVPPLACYNFDAHELILIFLAEMLPIK